MKTTLAKIDSEIWILLALSIFAWGPLLNNAYFFQAHDAHHSIFYLVEFDQTLRDGYLWPRWSPDFAFGYGYPLFNLYAPLAIYMAEIIHLLGTDKVVAVKTIYALTTIGAGLTMYGFVRRLFGQASGLLGAIVYMYAPFHLLEIYVRSAYAEYVSLMWLPLVLWMFTELIAAPNPRRLALAGCSYGLLALTHHTTFFTFTPFLILYILVLVAGRAKGNIAGWFRLGLANAGAGLLGVSLAGIYLVPVLLERNFIKIDQWTSGSYNATEHFVYLFQLFSPMWGYSYSGPGPIDGMSYQLGIVIYGLLIFSLVALVTFGRSLPHRGTALIFLGSSLLAIWLLLPWAEPIWRRLPLAELIQFPWRLLIVVMISLSIVVSAIAAVFTIERTWLMLITLIIILGSYDYTQPEHTAIPEWAETPLAVIEWDSFSPQDRVGMVVYTNIQPTTSPMEAQYRAGESLQVATVIAGNAQIDTIHHGGASDTVMITGGPTTIQFYTYDFPGWQVTLNGNAIPHRNEPPYGLITADVPAGTHTLALQMGSTPPRTIGTVLTILAIFIIGGGLLHPNITSRLTSPRRKFG